MNKPSSRKKSWLRQYGWTVMGCVISAVILLSVIGLLLLNSGAFNGVITVLRIGDHRFSAAEFNYFYNTLYNNVLTALGENVDYLFDPGQSLSSQYRLEGQSWKEYFLRSTVSDLSRLCVFYDEAIRNDFEIGEEMLSYVDGNVERVNIGYAYNGYASAEEYYEGVYGRGMNEEIYRRCLLFSVVAQTYEEQFKNSLTFSDAELESWYLERSDLYDRIEYHMFFISGDDPAAEDNARIVANAANEEEFVSAIAAYSGQNETLYNAGNTLYSYYGRDISANYRQWLIDDGRRNGDTAVIENENGFYVLYFLSRGREEQDSVSIYLIKLSGRDGASAEQRAEEAVARIENYGGDDAAFARTAALLSEDDISRHQGGLYEELHKGQLDGIIEEWAFSDERTVGETSILSDGGTCYVLRFAGTGEPCWVNQVKGDMISDSTQRWLQSRMEQYSVSESLFWNMTMSG